MMSSIEASASADPPVVAESSSPAADGSDAGASAADEGDDDDNAATATATATASSAGHHAASLPPPPPPPPSPPAAADPPSGRDDDDDDSNDSILSLSFNQDGGCLAVGTTRGFRICNVHPYQETFRRTFSPTHHGTGSGVGLVEMLFRCNLLLLGGGSAPSPLYPPNKLYVWDDHRSRPIGELSFRHRVLSTRLRRDRVAVCLIDRVYVYDFSNLRLLDTVHTSSNPAGLVALSPDPAPGRTALACPGLSRGHVRVELYELRRTTLVEAHEGSLAALALSVDGSKLCTASERGTIIRVFDTRRGGAPLRELRRGVERARMSCLCFSLDLAWVAAASDRGTVHVFRLEGEGDGAGGDGAASAAAAGHHRHRGGGRAHPRRNDGHGHHADSSAPGGGGGGGGGGGLVKSLVPRFARPFTIGEGEQSYAQIRGIEDPAVCAFVPDANRTIAVVGRDGSLLISDFSSGGEGERVAYHRFFRKRGSSGAAGVGSVGLRTDGEEGGRGGVGSSNGGDAVSREMDGVVFGDEEQEDGFIAVDNQSKIGNETAVDGRGADL